MGHLMYVRVCVSMYGYQVVCASVCICVCIGCFLFIAGVVHVKAHTVEESRCKYVCMCVCALWKPLNCSLSSSNRTKKKQKKHKRKKLKAKSTLAIQVDQNVTRGWRMVVAPTGPIKLRQQTYTHAHLGHTAYIGVYKHCDPSAYLPIDWSINRLIGQWTHKR